MSHTKSCRTRVERFGLITVHFSDPDQKCKDDSHHEYDLHSSEGHQVWTP